jgi:hypothetical protein
MNNCDCVLGFNVSGTTLSGESLGQKSLAPPFLAPNSSAAVTNSGINYGSGSSGIFDDTGSFYVRRFINYLLLAAIFIFQYFFLMHKTSL